MVFQTLPVHLHEHVFPHQYFPFFGRIHTARVATVAINCGPKEARHDRLGFRRCGLDLTRPLDAQAASLLDATTRPRRYFDPDTSPRADGFWSLFNPGGRPGVNPVHRDHYVTGRLAHVDVTPWATREVWSQVDAAVRVELLKLGRPILEATLRAAPNLSCLVVRGVTAAKVLADVFGAPQPIWQPVVGVYSLAQFSVVVAERTLPVVAVNQFRNIVEPVAMELVARVRAHETTNP